jgi:nitrous oxidase accessory protein
MGRAEMLITIALLLAPQAVLEVAPNSGYSTIAAAVADAPAGATVRVSAGVWREPTVVVTRPLTLVGVAGAVLDGEGERELVVVRAPGVTVRGFTFRNTGSSQMEDRAALRLDGARDCLVAENRFENTFFAIQLAAVDGCTVRDNVIVGSPGRLSSSGNAIHAWSSRHLEIRGNRTAGHRDGIYLEFTRHASVVDNVSEDNQRYGLHFMYADSSSYTGNTFRANGSGVAVMYTRQVLMRDNTFADNHGPTSYGLLFKEIADATLEGNHFLGNTTGLMADGAERVRVTGNTFADNGWAIRLFASTSGGTFTGNRFFRNAFDVSVNGRRTAATFRGNWWDAYRGWDLDGDGTGDVPHYPVRLFALLVERAPAAMLLQRSLFVRVLDAAERTLPVLTPRGVVDATPLARRPTEEGR